MRLSHGILKSLSEKTGISIQCLSDLVATRRRPSRKRALLLEKVCKDLGLDVSAILWLYGAQENIKRALSGQPENKNRREGDPQDDCGGRRSDKDRYRITDIGTRECVAVTKRLMLYRNVTACSV
jgi:hypothetical protein